MVFWSLEYWPLFETPHCLDIMHITKNVCESLLATLFSMPEKTKDGPRARADYKVLKIRKDLQLSSDEDDAETTCKGKKAKKSKEPLAGSQKSHKIGKGKKVTDRKSVV